MTAHEAVITGTPNQNIRRFCTDQCGLSICAERRSIYVSCILDSYEIRHGGGGIHTEGQCSWYGGILPN